MYSNYGRAVLSFFIFFLPLVRTQFVTSLPHCIQDCINQSQDDNCAVTNIGCLCRASAGNFLPDLITCMHGSCDSQLDNDLLLAPLQLACELVGAPIPASALTNAENQVSSLAATQATITITTGWSSSVSTAAVTTTVKGGPTVTVVYPVTIGSTTTVSGPASTVTTGSSNTFSSLVPVIVIGTDSAGSTYSSITTRPGVTSTVTTTDSSGKSTTQSLTYTKTTTMTTIISLAKSVSSSSTVSHGSETSEAVSPVVTNSSPFQNTSPSTASRKVPSNLIGLCLLVLGCLWVSGVQSG